MKKTPNKNHAHKFKRFSFKNGTRAFRCASCPTYILEDMIIGYDCVCWRCGGVFKIDAKSAKLSKPHCDCISRDFDSKDNEAIDILMKELT